MKKNGKRDKGITLVALSVTIIVLIIISSIAIYSGSKTIKKANLESLKTNMLLIEAKARECVEEANFKLGPNGQKSSEIENIRKKIYENEDEKSAGLKKISELKTENPKIEIPTQIPQGENVYWVTPEAMKKWGLDKIKLEDGEVYLIEFNEIEATVKIYNNLGFNNKYSLSEINQEEI